MSRARFVRHGEDRWRRLERAVAASGRRAADADLADVPRWFRRVCQDLALARHRQYGIRLCDRLNALALAAHAQLYRAGRGTTGRLVEFLVAGFPRAVRAHPWLFAWSCLLLFGPGIGTALGIQAVPELAYTILDGASLAEVEHMYDPGAEHIQENRPVDSDLLMFGFYVQHNIGIAFQTYAGGVLLGIGTVLVLLFNGFALGAVCGHVTRVGGGTPLWSFVIGHGAFELTGIAIAGLGGLVLARALVAPGRRTRRQALREGGRDSIRIVAGAAAMLTIAAGIEAFWSPRATVPPPAKYAVGGMLWMLVLVWLAQAGRAGRGPR